MRPGAARSPKIVPPAQYAVQEARRACQRSKDDLLRRMTKAARVVVSLVSDDESRYDAWRTEIERLSDTVGEAEERLRQTT